MKVLPALEKNKQPHNFTTNMCLFPLVLRNGAAEAIAGRASAESTRGTTSSTSTTIPKKEPFTGGSTSTYTTAQPRPALLSRLNARLNNFLFSDVSIAPLVYFRIVFGCIMVSQGSSMHVLRTVPNLASLCKSFLCR